MREQRVTDDLDRLLAVLPESLQQQLASAERRQDLLEVVLDLGRPPEARYPGRRLDLEEAPLSREALAGVIAQVGSFGGDNRAGIARTLHRISAMRNRSGEVIGLTCRVGRAVYGTVAIVRDLVESSQSILIMGYPGVGKTTVLREIARVLADELDRRVVVIDTSNEIAGDGDIPHPAIGRARRMQVPDPQHQHRVMIEAVENHMPEVIVIDEIGSEQEAWAARTIAERGVQLVATAHGHQLANLIKNPALRDLIGGLQAVTLGDEEARRRGSQKTVQERCASPTFPLAVEMHSRNCWHVHWNVARTVDGLLRDRPVQSQVRRLDERGVLHVQNPSPCPPGLGEPDTFSDADGDDLTPCPPGLGEPEGSSTAQHALPTAAAQDVPLRIYPSGVTPHQLDALIDDQQLPVRVVRTVDRADAVLSLRNSLSHEPGARRAAKGLGVPIHVIKSASPTQLQKALERLLLRFRAKGGVV
ncbi:MAG: ATPase AAA [Candidatus Synechococcus spongiarum 142]|uniref:ATPase AAA n=1 Tax=Candidatus Synechococcus spongiarum 142 TaxID=1608213 RepID=A0A6N3X1Z2_9SYNE|nr:MAG: ATPase AAA [Candidatus Synechococcus spongiarum 142]